MVSELSLRIAGSADAPAEARVALRRFHPELSPDLMQVIVLLASELVSNAVKHSGSESIAIRFEVLPSHVRVEVADEGPGFEPVVKTPAPGQLGGWGLHLVDEMSSRWGVLDPPGSRIWFEIDR